MTSALAQYLADDHARLDSLLRASIADEQRFDAEAFEQFRAGLLRHIGIEEKLLLPEARRRRGEPLALARALRIEHAALASLMVPTPDRGLAREIAGLLEGHNAREERDGGVYEECVELLGDEAAELLGRIRATPAPPLAKHFDGRGTCRTAADALSAAERHAQKKEHE
jgi:hypothetical protein